MSDFVALPESLEPHSLAEWIEILMIVDSEDDLSITAVLAMFPSGQRPSADIIELAFATIEDRSFIAPSIYPFRRIDDRVVRSGHPDSGSPPIDPCVYAFFRIATLQNAPWVHQRQSALVGSLFDYPVRDAMNKWLGDGSRSLIFGWPPRDGRPADFIDAVTWLAEQVGLPDGDLDRPPDANDAGVDCVTWKPSGDGRSGFPIWLIQASVEYDVVHKAGQSIPIEAWKRWIKFGAGPVTVFATAHSVPRGSNAWMELNDLAVQVVDRNRLIGLLDDAGIAHSQPDWLKDICDFVAAQLYEIRNPPEDVPSPRVRRRKRERTSDHADPLAR